MKNFNYISLICFFSANFLCLNSSAQGSITAIEKILTETNLVSQEVDWQITSEHRSSTSGVFHVYFQQRLHNIPVRGTESSMHFSSRGTLLEKNIHFENPTLFNGLLSTRPGIDAKTAIESAASQLGYTISIPIKEKGKVDGVEPYQLFSNGGIAARDIRARSIYTSIDDEHYILAWEVNILDQELLHSWLVEVSAEDGTIIRKSDLVATCYSHDHEEEEPILDFNKNLVPLEMTEKVDLVVPSNNCESCYEVFAMPLESPYYGDRTIVENPADPIASPFGWHDQDGIAGAEFTTTEGNNARVIEANDNWGFQPDGGATLQFSGYTFSQDYNQTFQHEEASLTNLFYWTNIIHDVTYRYGFTEAAGNFQANNYGRGGLQSDAVLVYGQSTNRRCNGSFRTDPDGEGGHMIINLCNNKDGNFDHTVIGHEYGHGLSARLAGGSGTNCLRNEENPSEGWSDWLGAFLTIKPEDTGATPRPIAVYLLNEGPNGEGVRFYPYSTNMNLNPLTYADLPAQGGRHRIGTIWGAVLWEMTWALIDNFGYDPDIYNYTGNLYRDAGNIMAMALVVEGLKFTPCRPGFVDARNGIILAAEELYGSEVVCIIWEAFAKRGLGLSAVQGDVDNQHDGIAAFDTPLQDASFEGGYGNFCIEYGQYTALGGGLPVGGVYSGPGVIDNGNGRTFTLDPEIAGIGVHTVFYNLTPTNCIINTEVTNQFEVVYDVEPPTLNCPQQLVVNQLIGVPYETPDFRIYVDMTDNCNTSFEYEQRPLEGTLLTATQNEVTILVRDDVGNEASCTFYLELFYVTLEESTTGFFSFFPNPARDHLTIFNPNEFNLESIEIWDLQGRRVQEEKIYNTKRENLISIAMLSQGTYFLRIIVSGKVAIYRLIKE